MSAAQTKDLSRRIEKRAIERVVDRAPKNELEKTFFLMNANETRRKSTAPNDGANERARKANKNIGESVLLESGQDLFCKFNFLRRKTERMKKLNWKIDLNFGYFWKLGLGPITI